MQPMPNRSSIMNAASLVLMRLRGILFKETLQILRDPSSIALAIVMPIILLFLFGYGVTLDAEHIPMAVVSRDNSSMARDLVARFDLSSNFTVIRAGTMTEAEEMVGNRSADCIIQIQSDFASRLESGHQAQVQLIINGIDANRARLIQGYVRSVVNSGPPCGRNGGKQRETRRLNLPACLVQ